MAQYELAFKMQMSVPELTDLSTEPDELRALYQIRLNRLEPVGLVYLWPTTRM